MTEAGAMLSAASDPWALLKEARAEVERLKAWAVDERLKRHKAEEDRMNARSEIEQLRAALREIITLLPQATAIARAALEPKP